MFQKTELGFKRHFLTIHFTVQSLKSPKNSYFFLYEMSQGGGGGGESQKSVTYYSNGPLCRYNIL